MGRIRKSVFDILNNRCNLIVRVAGYGDYFNDLGLDLQNEIIERTEHDEL